MLGVIGPGLLDQVPTLYQQHYVFATPIDKKTHCLSCQASLVLIVQQCNLLPSVGDPICQEVQGSQYVVVAFLSFGLKRLPAQRV